MEIISVNGGKQLNGSVTISGAKNAAVAVLPAVVLSDGICRIENLPDISDVSKVLKVLKELGASVKLINKSTVEIDPRPINSYVVTKEMAEGMRASSYFMALVVHAVNDDSSLSAIHSR